MFNRENKIPKHTCHSWCWSSSTTILLPSLSTLQGQFYTWEGVRKWYRHTSGLFFLLIAHWLRGGLALPNCPQSHRPLTSAFIFSCFSYKAVPGPHGQSVSLLFLQVLLRNMLLSLYLHPTTQCFTGIQFLVCWDHCLLYWQYSLSSLLQPHSYLYPLFLSYPQCASCLQQESSRCRCQPPPSSMAPSSQNTKS